jgi:hypothetical protein
LGSPLTYYLSTPDVVKVMWVDKFNLVRLVGVGVADFCCLVLLKLALMVGVDTHGRTQNDHSARKQNWRHQEQNWRSSFFAITSAVRL